MNIQQTIIKGIRSLLFRHDYLVLPGFGGFVLKSFPAHFSGAGTILHPPGKTLSFNSQLKQNDGVLTLWLQDALECGPQTAATHLQDFTDFCSGILKSKRRITLEGIGFFFLDFENNLCFEPQADVNFQKESFGLSALTLQPLVKEKIQRKQEFEDRKVPEVVVEPVPVARKRDFRKIMIPGMLAIIMVSVFTVLLFQTKISGEIQSAFFSGQSNQKYKPLEYENLTLAVSNAKPILYVADANGIASVLLGDKKVAVSLNEKKLNLDLTAGKFEIVMGCFSVHDNALRMVRKLSAKLPAAKISGQNNKGMFVVSAGSFANKDAAVKKLDELKSRYPQSWIRETW